MTSNLTTTLSATNWSTQGWNPFYFEFPDRNPCFGLKDVAQCSGNTTDVTATMLQFLNLTDFNKYFDAYCLNPPDDSCAFGFCPNPDVASPTVRYSTYFTTVMSAVLVLYLPEEVASTFFSQLLNVYSLIIAALIAVAKRNLTKPHTAVALGLACSPLSAYLIIYVIRSLFGGLTRLHSVFGKGMWLPRLAVLMLVPVWITLLILTSVPNGSWRFQQTACDAIVANHHILQTFFEPFLILSQYFAPFTGTVFGIWFITWAVAIYLRRNDIWKSGKGRFPLLRMWRKVVDHYPFIQFCTVIAIPHIAWIINIEMGVAVILTRESFSYTYGQMLALLVTIPPIIQLVQLTPRLFWWFVDLTWVRFVSFRRNKPRHNPPLDRRSTNESTDAGGEYSELQDTLPLVEPKHRVSFSQDDAAKSRGVP
ncbi:hypothetical protein MIND_00824000 [Mycena indigotica]|uniref:Uncharacterized protein n=1 Tax=Mycena indigotica TaxID=2126181 RepID=A0A8H6W4A7_9AGAR|nr:uncharacterized protein MIND_00824000 [Mycena indigotica]KAF7298764.1 hypothetical protein MIND_00824000 [Mycena indigotica]